MKAFTFKRTHQYAKCPWKVDTNHGQIKQDVDDMEEAVMEMVLGDPAKHHYMVKK